MRRLSPILLLAFVILFAGAAPACAQQDSGARRIGTRVGFTVHPDQFHFGFHVNAAMLAPRWRFQPGLEVGFGNDRTIVLANLDALYLLHRGRTVQSLVGAGLGAGGMWFNNGPGSAFEGHDRPPDGLIGVNLVAAIEWGTRPIADIPQNKGSQTRYLLEVRAGIGDLPAFKTTLGINF